MFNGLLVVVTMSAVWLPYWVNSVEMGIGLHVSCPCSEDQCLISARQIVALVTRVRLLHVPVDRSSCVCTGPPVVPVLFALGKK